MKTISLWRSGRRATTLAVALLTIGANTPRAEPQTALVLENIGLKNIYRIVFNDLQANYAGGVFEVFSQDEESPPNPFLRLPFRADIRPDPKNRNIEILEVSTTELVSFFPPANRKDPHPKLIWRLTDRTGKNPKLEAPLWSFGREAWTVEDMEFVKPKP
jgi:hypothetical protein